jgi:hypothetical protein
MSKLSARLAEVAIEIMGAGEVLTPGNVGAIVADRYPDLLDAASKYFIDSGLWRELKRVMRDQEEDEQEDFPGLGFPRVITLPGPDGTCLKLASFATWEELVAALELRDTNIDRASARRERFSNAMKQVRPFMEGHPEVRVCDVMAQLGIEDPHDTPYEGAPAEA